MATHPGVREIYIRRVRSTVVCSILHQILVVLAYLGLVYATPLQPFIWFKTCLCSIFSLKLLAGMLFMSVITFLQVTFFSKRLTLNPPFTSTRLKAFIRLFSLDNVFSFLLHIMTGFVMGYFYVSLEPENEQQDEVCVFKRLSATFTGLYFFVQDFTSASFYLQLPILAGGSAKAQVKQDAIDSIKSSIWPSMKAFLYFNMLYYFFGAGLGKIFSIILGDSSNELTSIFQLLHLWRLQSSYLLCLMVVIVLTTMKKITQTMLSRRCKFAITQDHFLLSEALALSDMPFIQQLASQDLFILAESDPARRAELYLLSQPGGHPHNWQAVFKPFLALVDSICNELTLIPPAEAPKAVQLPENIPHRMSPRLRNLALDSQVSPSRSVPSNPAACTSMSSTARDWFKQQVDLLLKKPPVAFVFGERTEARIAHALITKGQTLAYLVSAFSSIAQASSTEDTYGVVQQDLPAIITAILKLKTAVDKLGNVFRKQNKSQSMPHLNIKSFLRESTVRGLYRIVITFKSDLGELRLPADVKSQLHGFANFKET